MKKNFKWLLALVAMVASINLMAGDCDISDDFSTLTNNTSFGTRTSTDGWKATNATVEDFNSAKSVKLNGKKDGKGDLTSPTFEGGCSHLSFTYGSANDEKANCSVVIKDTKGSILWSSSVSKNSITKGTAYTFSEDVTGVTGNFILVVTNTSTSTSTKNVDRLNLCQFCITSASSKTETTTTFGDGVDDQTFDAAISSSFTAKTASVYANSAIVTGASIKYSSSNTAAATVNETTGAISIIAKGKTDITATYAGDDTYKGSSAKYTINVINPNEKVLWSEDWSSGSTDGYTLVDGSTTTKLYNENNAGGTSPEILVSKGNGSFSTPSISLQGSTGPYVLTFKANNTNFSVSSATLGVSVGTVSKVGSTTTYTCTITIPDGTESITLTFSNSKTSNTRLDDFELIGAPASSTVKATVLANPTTAGSVSAEDEDGNEVTSETELDPEQFITVTASVTDDDYYFYNWTLASGDDAEIDKPTNTTTDVMMGSKNATITANFFPWANLSVAPTSTDLELPLSSADGSFEVTVTSDQEVTFANEIDAIVTPTELVDNAAISAKIKEGSSSKGKTTTYVVEYMFDAAGSYTATIEFTGTDNQSKAANSATLTINATVKDLETLAAPVITIPEDDGITAKSVTLTWPSVANAIGYSVEMKLAETPVGTVGEITGDDTKSCTITGLTAGTTYTYIVTAIGDGENYLSSSASADVKTKNKSVVEIKDAAFVRGAGKYYVSETLDVNDFTITKVNNDDSEEKGAKASAAYVVSKDEAPYVFTEADATAGTKTITLKFNNATTTIDVPVESFPKYTIKFSVPSCITPVADAKVNQGSALDLTDITTENPSLDGYSFAGWSTESIAEGSASGKLISSYTPTADNTTLYAVYKYDKQQGTAGWVKEDLANLSATDVFVITGTKGETTYSMSNNNGASNPPTATSITISNNKISGAVEDNIKWNVSGNATDGYVFYPNGVTDKYLYATNTNNGVRVGTGDAKTMTITSGYLTVPTSTTRYIGVYVPSSGTPDWRCYDGYTSSNIKDQTFAYYKYQAGGDVYKYTSTIDCSEPHTIIVIIVPESVTGGTVSATPTSAKQGTTITVTYAPAENHTVGTLTWTAEGDEPNDLQPVYGKTEYTFEMPDANVTIAATFEEIEHVNISWVIDGGDPQVIPTVKGAQVAPPTVTETCNEKIKFMGWTASETITSKPADLFNDADAPFATEEKTYYSVYAQEDEGTQPAADAFYTATFTKLTSGDNFQNYTKAHEFTSGTITWSVIGNQGLPNDGVRIGGNHTTDQNRVTQTTDKIGSKIAKVVINHAGKSNDNFTLNSITLDVASDAGFVNILATKTLTPSVSKGTTGTIEFTPEVGTVWAKDSYYRFTVNCKTGGSNCGLDVASIAFYPNGGTEYSGYSTTCQAPVTIADPEFTIPSGKYTETQHVEINCETAGVTIYYTLDGSNPKDSETKQTYSTAVEIEEPGATLKAIATDGADHWSNVVTATYEVDKGYVTSIAEFITRDPKESYGLKWTDADNAYITAIKSESGDKVSLYVQDASAGIMIYNVSLPEGAAVGKKMVGTITGKHTAYNFQEELTSADFTNIAFSDATRPTATPVTALDATAYAANPMKLVKLTNVKFQSTTVAASNTVKDASENEYVVYNTLGMMTGKVLPDADVVCDVTGILVKFGYNTENVIYELLPVLVTDIDTKGAIAAAPIFNPAGAETLGAAEVAEGSEVALSAAVNCKINYGSQVGVASTKAYLTNVDGEDVTVTSTRDFYANNAVTRYFKADPKSIQYAINGLCTDDNGNKVQAKVDGEFVTNTYKDAEVTLIFTPATHYTTTSATLDGDALTIIENQATFTMKGQAVTIETIFTEDAKATATFAAGGATGGSVESITKYLGEKFNLPSNGFTYDNHKFLGWKLSDDETLYQPGTEIKMVEGGFDYTAQWQEKPDFSSFDWKLVKNADDIAAGNYYVLASNANKAVAGEIVKKSSNDVMDSKEADFSENKEYVTLPEGTVILTLESAGSGIWYFVNADNDKKLGSTAANKMAWDGGTMTWSIAMGDKGALTITNSGTGIGTLRYNSGSPRFTTYTSTSMTLPQFYMAVPKVYQITYNVNGGDVESQPEASRANDQGIAKVTKAVPTFEAHKFIGWKDASNNEYVADKEVTLTADLELIAQWQEVTKHKLAYNANGGNLKPGKSAIADEQVYEAVKVTVAENVYTIEGYVFDGWEYNDVIYNPGDKFDMPNGDVTFVAQWRNESDSKWHLVTNEAMLTDGSKIMIASKDANFAMGGFTGTHTYCDQVVATKSIDAAHFNDNKLIISETSPVAFTLVKNEDGSFALKNGDNYLSAQSTGNNIKYIDEINDMSSWTISIDENAVATIETTGEADSKYIQHNASAYRFSCYSSTTQGAIAIYKEIDGNKAVREVTAGAYTTFCIPQGVEVGNFYGATFWNIEKKSTMGADNRLSSITIVEHEENVEAGVPYIMLADENVTEFVYYATGEAVDNPAEEGNNGLVGVFATTMFDNFPGDAATIDALAAARGIYIISDGTLYLCGNNCGVYANRAYIVNGNITDQSAKAPAHAARRTIGNPNGTPTNLNGLNGNVKAQKALIDGHIYIIRDNKMYNAQGLFVK